MPRAEHGKTAGNGHDDLLLAGIDIGGTQCSVNLGRVVGGNLDVICRDQFLTDVSRGPGPVLAEIQARLTNIIKGFEAGAPGADSAEKVAAVGISCGGPLDSERGLVHSPPNLPGWDEVPVVAILSEAFNLPCFLENDANAGALAEWQFGAAKGADHVVFLTFGTGLGAGLIVDGRLYRGRSGLAGEVGHWRVGPDNGPVRYAKAGSLEAFCSGSGIVGWYQYLGGDPDVNGPISAKVVAERARGGDPVAGEVFETAARYLGLAVAFLGDVLAPDVVVIGGIFGYAQDLLCDGMRKALRAEVHPAIGEHLHVVPASLGSRLGSFASCCVALDGLASKGDAGAHTVLGIGPGLRVRGNTKYAVRDLG